jgi:hypothetical protein
MTFNNAVVWLDHTKAQVIHFDKDASESEAMKTHSTHAHPRQNHADTHANEDDNTAFVKYLTAKLPEIAGNIKAVETVDHPSDGQLLTYARRHFTSNGGLK